MMEMITSSIYFGVVLTVGAFVVASFINKKFPNPFTTPLFLATMIVIAFLLLFRIPYENYNFSAKYLTYFLVPITVCFAVPMYRQLPLLKRHIWTILFAVFVGCVASVASVCIVVILFGLADVIARSLVSISVTTALAVGITRKLGGIVSLTVSAVIVTGILGASVSDKLCKWLKLKNPISRGIAIGNAAHAAGTVKAMEMGQIEGSFSSLTIVLSGLMTAVLGPLAIWVYFGG
ncbi:MAG: LrgB family protein [Alphaproteobacteria bacterium]|nr:LrgB family protein [Alphaproteobacteria bacterium]